MKHERKHEDKKSANTKLIIMAVAVGMLIVVSGIQAFALVELKNKLNSELITLSSSGAKASADTIPQSALSNNLKNLPSMVGGC